MTWPTLLIAEDLCHLSIRDYSDASGAYAGANYKSGGK
jgi:hypothetical protein